MDLNNFIDKISKVKFKSNICNEIISKLYTYKESKKLEEILSFREWKYDFVNIHGRLDTQRKVDFNELEKAFKIKMSSTEDLFFLIFCLESYFCILLKFMAFKAITNKSLNIESIQEIFEGKYFISRGIINYYSPSYYNWISTLVLILIIYQSY